MWMVNVSNMHMFSKLDTYVTYRIFSRMNKNHQYYLLIKIETEISRIKITGIFIEPIMTSVNILVDKHEYKNTLLAKFIFFSTILKMSMCV